MEPAVGKEVPLLKEEERLRVSCAGSGGKLRLFKCLHVRSPAQGYRVYSVGYIRKMRKELLK